MGPEWGSGSAVFWPYFGEGAVMPPCRKGRTAARLPGTTPPSIVGLNHRERGRLRSRRIKMASISRCFSAAAGAALVGAILASPSAATAQECKNRGQLDTLYCDDNNDLVSDAPTDPR